MAWLLILYTLGILIAAIAAMVDIESIMGSGPIMSLVGIWIAFLSYRRDHPIGLFYGLAVPTVSVFCFIVINGLDWGPSDAHVPVSAFLVLFAWGSFAPMPWAASVLPLGWGSCCKTLSDEGGLGRRSLAERDSEWMIAGELLWEPCQTFCR